jgi:molybdopterin-guanine dinucleotide biosynthesis protein B
VLQVIPVVSVVGKSNTGKTTFLVKLITELKSRGYRLAIVKHNVHGFDIDHPGKDTFKHAEAGADAVVIASPHKFAMIRQVEKDIAFDDIIGLLGSDYDIIITEGYKSGPYPKIEVSRKECSTDLLSSEDELIAIVTDNKFEINRPHLDLDDAAGVADIVVEKFLNK